MSDLSMSSINSYFSSSYQNTDDTNSVKLKSKIENLNTENSSDEELKAVCKEFETYLVEQLVKSMEETVDVFSSKEDKQENSYMNYFGDYLYQEYASNIVDSQELGIAQMLYESMKR